ncbi:MAG: ComF family protein [Clostridia bacterium]|nr:ComF family protein [Clostridia bacterium]
MAEFWRKILDALFPRGITCDGCGRELTDADDRSLSLCKTCSSVLVNNVLKPISVLQCDVYSAFEYDSVRDLILRCKDESCPYLAATIAGLTYRFFVEKNISADVVCYVPCGKKARERRGYDHMEHIAEEFSARSGLPIVHALERVKETSDQTVLTAEERFENVRDCFVGKIDLTGKTILLLDDLVTTGATLSAAIHALKTRSQCKVVCLTLGKA